MGVIENRNGRMCNRVVNESETEKGSKEGGREGGIYREGNGKIDEKGGR